MGGVGSVDAAAVKLVLPLDGIAGVHPADVDRGLCKAVQCKAVGTGARGVDKQNVIDSWWGHGTAHIVAAEDESQMVGAG